jgi:hypothetical protein
VIFFQACERELASMPACATSLRNLAGGNAFDSDASEGMERVSGCTNRVSLAGCADCRPSKRGIPKEKAWRWLWIS